MTEPMLTLSAAVKASNVSLSTMRRHLNEGRIPGARRTTAGWQIPISGLVTVGYVLRTTPAEATTFDQTPVTTVDDIDTTTQALQDENSRLRQTVQRLEAQYEAQRDHLEDMRKAIELLAQALPMPTQHEPVATTADSNASGPVRRRWPWRRSKQ